MEIRLIVIRTNNLEPVVAFYRLLGFTFDYHQHGNGPFHYAASVGSLVLEIYPLAKGQAAADKHLRLGFAIDNFEGTLEVLRNQSVTFADPVQTAFGFMTVVADPDGRKTELYKK